MPRKALNLTAYLKTHAATAGVVAVECVTEVRSKNEQASNNAKPKAVPAPADAASRMSRILEYVTVFRATPSHDAKSNFKIDMLNRYPLKDRPDLPLPSHLAI